MTEPQVEVVPQRRKRRFAFRLLVAAAAVAAGAYAFQVVSDATRNRDPDVDPTAIPRFQLDAAQSVLLVYTEWERAVEVAACMDQKGFDYEPDLERTHDRFTRAADSLGIAARAPQGALIGAAMRNEDYFARLPQDMRFPYREALFTLVDDGGCRPPGHIVLIDDQDALRSAGESAVVDDEFLAYIAEMRYLEENPVAALESSVLIGVDPAPPTESEREAERRELAERLADAIRTEMFWVPEPVVETADYAQIAGSDADGGAFLIRVVEPEAERPPYGNWGAPPVRLACADLAVDLATWPWEVTFTGTSSAPVGQARDAIELRTC